MTGQDVRQLKERLQGIRAFPVAGQQWASLADGPMVNDDPNLASLFQGIRGVVLLARPTDPSRYEHVFVFALAALHSYTETLCLLQYFGNEGNVMGTFARQISTCNMTRSKGCCVRHVKHIMEENKFGVIHCCLCYRPDVMGTLPVLCDNH